MADVNDMDLVREYADRNSERAFAELVHRHVNLVYSVALRFTGHAQDVTQAIFIIFAQKAGSLHAKTILTGWLYETTRFTAMRFMRTKASRQLREQEAYMSTLNDSNSECVWRQLAPLLEEAMGRLSEKERTLVVLRFFDNKSAAETATLFGIQEWAAHKRVERAMEKLRRFFMKRGVTVPVTAMTTAISVNSVQTAPIALAKTATIVALAKGATVSVSTSILIKGTLKIMAWTKAKAVAIAAVVVILTASTTTLVIKTVHVPRAAVYQPIPDNEPEITARMRSLKLEDLRAEDCTPEFWRQLQQSRQSANPEFVKALPAAMGQLRTVTLVERTVDHGRPSYLYRMEYQNMNVLFRIVFDGKKIAYANGYQEPK